MLARRPLGRARSVQKRIGPGVMVRWGQVMGGDVALGGFLCGVGLAKAPEGHQPG